MMKYINFTEVIFIGEVEEVQRFLIRVGPKLGVRKGTQGTQWKGRIWEGKAFFVEESQKWALDD